MAKKKDNNKPWYEIEAEKRGLKWSELSESERKTFMDDTKKSFKEKGIPFTPDDNKAMIQAGKAFEDSQNPFSEFGDAFKEAFQKDNRKFSNSEYIPATPGMVGNDGGAFNINLPWSSRNNSATIPHTGYPGRAEHQAGKTAAPKGHEVPDRQVADTEVVDDSGGSGNGGGGGSSSTTTTETTATTSELASNEPYDFSDANRPYWQAVMDTYDNREPRDQFQFDDTYAPDSQGFRDVPGYIMDTGKAVIGAIGANKPLDDYEASDDFKQMTTEARNRRNLGMTQQDRQQAVGQMDRAYNYDVKNIRDMAGGSGGAAMANLGGASQRYYNAQGNLDQIDQALKQQNREQFYNTAMAGENVNQFAFNEKRGREMMSKMAAGNLMADAMDNITHRKEYEDTYLKPGSQYYELMKEQNLGMRQNRELLEFSRNERIKDLEAQDLFNRNLAQEEIAEIDRQKNEYYDNSIAGINQRQEEEAYANRHVRNGTVPDFVEQDYRDNAVANGNSPDVTSAEDFKNYEEGTPVEKIVKDENNRTTTTVGGDDYEYLPPNALESTVGLTNAEMANMTDEELNAQGIDKTSSTSTYIDPNTGAERTAETFNYGTKEEMEGNYEEYVDDKGVKRKRFVEGTPNAPSDTDQEFLDLETVIDQEYSSKEKELMDKYYATDERRYNKEMKKLKEQKIADLKKRQEEYLKK